MLDIEDKLKARMKYRVFHGDQMAPPSSSRAGKRAVLDRQEAGVKIVARERELQARLPQPLVALGARRENIGLRHRGA